MFIPEARVVPLVFLTVIFAFLFSEKYWMPFLAKHSSTMAGDLKFAPPLDIHWVWHVHMLAPVQYNKDCTATVDRMLGKHTAIF